MGDSLPPLQRRATSFFVAESEGHVHEPEQMMVPFTSSVVLSETLLTSTVTTKSLSRSGKHTFTVRSRYAHSLLWLPHVLLIAQVEKSGKRNEVFLATKFSAGDWALTW